MNALLKRFSEKRPEPMSSSDSSDSTVFASAFFSSAGAAVVAGPGPPAPEEAPDVALANAFANKPGQKGSTFTPAAFFF